MKPINKSKSVLFSFLILFMFFAISLKCKPGINKKPGDEIKSNKETIMSEIQQVLAFDFDLWYPLSIDTVYGGFFSDIDYKWELQGRQAKMIVTQARHVWSNANASLYYPDKERYLKVAEHGFKFLKNVMWDKEHGGFYNFVDRQGNVFKEDGEIIKRAYGNSFAIYGLAAYYRASGNEEALKLAQDVFNWLEKYSYDPEYGGYFQFVSAEGKTFKDGYNSVPPKDQNTMIHVLECFTELYKSWPDPILKERLTSLLFLIRDKIVIPKGYLNLFFNRDMSPISFRNTDAKERERNYEYDHVSFGHDVEIAYLMLETSEVLGMENDIITLKVAKRLVDHALANGYDETNGGLFDRGYYFAGQEKISIIKRNKEWWCQAEVLNSFLLMSKYFPNDSRNYYEKFCEQWNYIKKYVVDFEYGGWYWEGADIEPYAKESPKGTIWKCNYHTSRALINCLEMLKTMK